MGDVVTALPGGKAKAELDCVLGSAVMVRSPRLARLLKYLCTKYFDGEADQIKEYNIAVDVLDRPESFDPAQDAIARVEVHRLRKKLREYYENEGAHHSVRVVIPPGRYAPVFMPATQTATSDEPATADSEMALSATGIGPSAPLAARDVGASLQTRSAAGWPVWKRIGLLLLAGLVLAALLIPVPVFRDKPSHAPSNDAGIVVAATTVPEQPSIPALPAAGEEVRILCGQSKPRTDSLGRTWAADRYFVGGNAAERPLPFLARTSDPSLFAGVRTGDFSYHIPLQRGVYELHLYFAETTFGPGTSAGGGENYRVFHVAANGRRILSDFDIISDAGGPGIADERVFKDISPGPDGVLHLRFMSERSQPIVSAIVLEPARPHLLNPVRVSVLGNPHTDSQGRQWMPDNYWSGGQVGVGAAGVQGTQDPNLYIKERYGNFSYAIPVDAGEYAVTLYFAETYWGPENPGGGGVGTRVFDLLLNGVALLRNFDVYKETGGGRALIKTFHGLQPSSQGRLLLSFVPVRNYASLRAIEVLDESR